MLQTTGHTVMGQTPLPAPRRNVYFLFYPSVQLISPSWQRLLYTKIHGFFFPHTARPHFSASLTFGFALVTGFSWSRMWSRSRTCATSRLEQKHTPFREHSSTCSFLLPTNWGRGDPQKNPRSYMALPWYFPTWGPWLTALTETSLECSMNEK